MISIGRSTFRVLIDEDQGGEIIHVGPDGGNILAHYDWDAPIPASRSSSYDAGGPLDWLSSYRGGWQCLVPNAGDACVVDGVPLPFHGEWSRTRVEVAEVTAERAVLRAGTRLPLTVERVVEVLSDHDTVRVQTTLRNDAAAPVAYIWGEHPAFALGAGARLHIPADRVEVDATPPGPLSDLVPAASARWPQVPTDAGHADLATVPDASERFCYLVDVPESWAVAIDGERAISLAWDREAFPHLWFWQERGGSGFPWYGRPGITAVEPATHWPSTNGLAGAIERGQARIIEPGASASSWMSIGVSHSQSGRPSGVAADGTIEYEGD